MSLDSITIDNILQKSSFIGLLTLYFVKLKFDKRQGFSKSDFDKIYTGEYVYGYFVACGSFGLYVSTTNNNIISITEMNSLLSEKIYAAVHQKASEQDKKNPESKWLGLIEKIENI